MKSIRRIHFDPAADVPNIKLPVLVYRSVLANRSTSKARVFRDHFKANGWVESGQIRYMTTPTSIPMLMRCSASRR
jgi:uncharacterized protein YjlB